MNCDPIMRARHLALVMAFATLAACTGSSAHRGAASVPHTSTGRHPHVVAAQPRTVVYASFATGGRELVFVGPVSGRPGRTRLLAASPDGRRFADIGPRIPRDYGPDSAFFLDAQRGWFTVFSPDTVRDILYRTADGGPTWKSTYVPSHSMAGGSTDAIQFTDARHGWLADLNPTGPNAILYRTSDGGRSWHRVAKTSQPGKPSLRTVGPVDFRTGGEVGWQVSEFDYAPQLFVTHDAGQTWRSARIPARHRGFALPALFGGTVLEPVTSCAGRTVRVQMYVSTDDGARWSTEPATTVEAHRNTHSYSPCDRVSTSLPSRDVAWVATLDAGHVVVKRSTDGGGHWHSVAAPTVQASRAPTISALDARHAWLQVWSGGPGQTLYATSDAGHTWQRVEHFPAR